MHDEIELKLAAENIQIEQLTTIFAQFNVIEHQKAFLVNTYYDRADGYLPATIWGCAFGKKTMIIR